ncbi:MAG TPA: hypothetical protein PLY34_20265 [Ferruginibacter sp.]|nr:hypothetical protein [Ferruginibacter sp.]
MINLRKGNTETIYFTGTEKATLTAPRFLFVFTNKSSNEEVKINLANTSTVTRYDRASVVVNTYFTNKTDGLWSYQVYEKSDTSTTVSGTLVEEGFMRLKAATDFAPEVYTEQSNSFKVYNGE